MTNWLIEIPIIDELDFVDDLPTVGVVRNRTMYSVPDLRRPASVGWALCAVRQQGGVVAAASLPDGLLVRWLRGATTDDDRLALARALREVVDG